MGLGYIPEIEKSLENMSFQAFSFSVPNYLQHSFKLLLMFCINVSYSSEVK